MSHTPGMHSVPESTCVLLVPLLLIKYSPYRPFPTPSNLHSCAAFVFLVYYSSLWLWRKKLEKISKVRKKGEFPEYHSIPSP